MEERNERQSNSNVSGLEISAFENGEVKEMAPFEYESGEAAQIFVNEIYLNISKRLRVIRFILLFAVIVITLFSIMTFSSRINIYSIKEFLYSFGESEISLEAASVSISGADLIKADAYKNYLLMLRDDRVELYKGDGTRYMTKRISMSKPTVKTSDKYFLIYDLGGYKMSLYNTVDVIYEQSFDNTIYIADVNDKGYFALLTHDVSFASQLIVFNESMERVFEWTSADKYTPCMEMLSDGSAIATASYFSNLGIPTTTFNLFNVKSDTAVTCEFANTLPLQIGEIGEGIYLLCTDKLIFFNNSGEIVKEVETANYGSSVTDVYCNGEALALVLDEDGYSYASRLVLFDENGNSAFTCEERYEISSSAIINDELYYIHYGELVSINLKDKTEIRTSLTNSYSDILEVSGKLVLTSDIETLIFS